MELFRAVRNSYTRTVYDRLKAVGLTATVMLEYTRHLDVVPPVDPPKGYEITRCSVDRVTSLDAPVEEVHDDERVIGAFREGTPSGYLFVSHDARLRIQPLERNMSFAGGYVRRVYVAPDHRRRGVAGALLRLACALGAELGADRITALVAVDNLPSRTLFEATGFKIRRRHRYARAGPLSHYSTTKPEWSRQ